MNLTEEKRKKRGECAAAMEEANSKIEDILKKYGKHQHFYKSDLYIMSPDTLSLFTQIEDSLSDFRNTTNGKKSVRKRAYSINKIVNLINPDNVAYQYDLTMAKKYVYLSTKELCIEEAKVRVEISANIQRKNLREDIERHPEYSLDFIKKIEDELEKKIEDERNKVDEVIKNPDSISSIKISGFKNLIEYGQINYGYFHKDKLDKKGQKLKVRTNAHLSIVYPNVLFFEPDEETDKHRSLMEAKYLEDMGYVEICRDVYVKYSNTKTKKGE